MKWLPSFSAIALSICAGLAEPEFATDKMSDAELREFRNQMRAELQRLLETAPTEESPEGKVYRVYYCTIYYTPRESGFTAERGFDDTRISAPGLKGRKYPVAFLEAVRREGFGRLIEPVNGREYLQYVGGGRYQFAKAALGNRGNVLVSRRSCAISKNNRFLRRGQVLRIDSPTVQDVTGSSEWRIEDTGGGLHPLQIDLYWGEDDPLGAVGRMRARPAGTRMEYAFDVKVLIKPD
ncbi:MAG TPA: hypothetical protein VIT00_07850 [Terrimicrobiaceae bacterium]